MDKFKPQMTFDEMARAFSEDNPWLKPNNTNVGLFAKRHGYVKIKQMINRKIEIRYVKS